jgi:hypothetical protein
MSSLPATHAALCEPYVQLRRRYFSNWILVGTAFVLFLATQFIPPTPEVRVAVLLCIAALIVF